MKKILITLAVLLLPSVAFASTLYTTATANRTNTNFVYGGQNFTLEFWFKLTNLAQNNGIIAIDQSGAVNNSRALQFYVGTGGTFDGGIFPSSCSGVPTTAAGSIAMATGTWYYSRLAWDGTNYSVKIFNRDQTVFDSVSVSAANVCADPSMKLTFARVTQNTFTFSGEMRNAWWADAGYISDAESKARMYSSLPPISSPHTGHHFWPMSAGGDIRDLFSSTTSTELNTPTTGFDPPYIRAGY